MTHEQFLLSSIAIACLATASPAIAAKHDAGSVINLAPQPTSCVSTTFTTPQASEWYTEVDIKLTNNCGTSVDLRDATVTFTNGASINLNGWGIFPSPVSYPDSINVSSQANGTGKYLTSVNLTFPTDSWVDTKLPVNNSVTIQFGINSAASFVASSAQVYLPNTQPAQTGTLALTNSTPMPSGVNQAYAVVNLAINGVNVKSVNLPWNSSLNVTGLSTGTYSLLPQSLTDASGNTYQGTAIPSSVTVSANQTVNAAVNYTEIAKFGSINVQVPALPAVLVGYTDKPSVTFTSASNSTFIQSLPWNATTAVTQLENNTNYTFSTPAISFNGAQCTGSFNPTNGTSSASNAPRTVLSYQCSVVTQDKVTINVSGASSTTSSVNVTFTPSNNSTPIIQAVTLANGSGTATVNLTDGVIYNVSASSVNGYNVAVNPSTFTAKANVVETVTYTKQAPVSGRIVTYIPGWKTPPTAADLAKAGYTHVMIAFGLFSLTNPGQIVPAFDTITTSYISELHNNGIKVLLSLGGASSSIPGAVVDFHQVISAASSPTAFVTTFVQSVKSMMTQYGFDGVDIDIEQGLGVGGTFTQPTGDVGVLASIINKLRADNPNMLITLVPQVANVSATAGFDQTWGNYASLITQTGPALSWVQIQLYNTGCAFGIDQVCYDPNKTSSPDFAVAMATDLLADWPATVNGQATGFQPYKGSQLLTPSQAGVGFPAPDASGASDGAPVTPVATIKRAIQCMRTAVKGPTSCDSYVPPQAYPGFGTVFNWEATYDQNNGYKFATGLTACVLQGSC